MAKTVFKKTGIFNLKNIYKYMYQYLGPDQKSIEEKKKNQLFT